MNQQAGLKRAKQAIGLGSLKLFKWSPSVVQPTVKTNHLSLTVKTKFDEVKCMGTPLAEHFIMVHGDEYFTTNRS